MRRHAPFLVLLALAAAAMFHFAASQVVASLGDDSVSYLMLARHILDPQDAINREWVGYQSHFPPLFPAILAITGGATNLAMAHAVVATFAVLSLVVLYRYAAIVLGGDTLGLLLTALFLLTPTAWISISGVLSESLFLFATLCALYYHETRLNADMPPRDWLVFGVLLGAAVLVRTAGVALVIAYGVHAAIAAAKSRERGWAKRLLPFVPVALMVALWLAWRPRPEGFNYASVTTNIVKDLFLADPVRFLASCAEITFGGWTRTFTADVDVHWVAKAVFGSVGLMGIVGALLRARANRLDGWLVLVMLPMVFVWLFSDESNRRLLYPLVPILLIHAAFFAQALARRIGSAVYRRVAVGAAVALPVLLCLPAFVLVQSRSWDLELIHPQMPYRYADMTDYYTTLDRDAARAVASKHAAVLGGLESLRTLTPPDARTLWLRPDYVAVLGRRHGAELPRASDRDDFLRKVRLARADYFVVSSLFKAGMDGDGSSPQERFNWALQASRVVHSIRSRAGDGYDIAILELRRAP